MTRFTEWAAHAVKKTGWDLDPRAAFGGLALVSGLALLAAFYLALSSNTAVLGRELQAMEATRAALERENAHLRDRIAEAASAATLMQQALADGFVITDTILFVPVSSEPAGGEEQSGTPP